MVAILFKTFKMKKKVIITEKGAALKTNSWVNGQEMEFNENIANHFVETGIAKWPETGEAKEESKTTKDKKSK